MPPSAHHRVLTSPSRASTASKAEPMQAPFSVARSRDHPKWAQLRHRKVPAGCDGPAGASRNWREVRVAVGDGHDLLKRLVAAGRRRPPTSGSASPTASRRTSLTPRRRGARPAVGLRITAVYDDVEVELSIGDFLSDDTQDDQASRQRRAPVKAARKSRKQTPVSASASSTTKSTRAGKASKAAPQQGTVSKGKQTSSSRSSRSQ